MPEAQTRCVSASNCRSWLTTAAVVSIDSATISPEKLAAIQKALESAGVIFVAENGEGLGMRLRKGKRK